MVVLNKNTRMIRGVNVFLIGESIGGLSDISLAVEVVLHKERRSA